MNKSQLIAAVVANTGDKVTESVAAESVDAVFSSIVRAVAKGDTVTITGFGVFEKRARARRTARNPRTGEVVKVPATKVANFRPSESFKLAVAGKTKLPKTGSVIRRGGAVEAPAPAKKAPAKKVAAKKAAPAKKVAAPKPVSAKKAPAKKAAPVKKTTKKGATKKK